jgi:ATP-binding cassette subfamily B multidrug efflux pump
MNERQQAQSRPVGFPMGMGRGPVAIGSGEKAKHFKTTINQLLHYLRPFWFSIILVFVFALASTVFAIFSPKILGQITNQIVDDYTHIVIYNQLTSHLPKNANLPVGTTGEVLLHNLPQSIVQKIPADKLPAIKAMDFSQKPTINFEKIRQIVFFLLGLYLLSAGFTYLQNWIMSGISQEITYKFRKDISEKINRLPIRYFDGQTHGEVLSRVTNDVDTISQTLNQSLTQIVTSITMIIGILIMMFTISWELTVISLILLPVSFLMVGGIIKRSQKYYRNQQATLGKLDGHIEEMYSGHNVMKVFNGEKRSVEEFQKINKELFKSAWKAQFLSGLMMPIMNFVSNLGFVCVSALGGYLAVTGYINIGDIQAFIQYNQQFNQPIMQTANIANVLQSTAASAERVFEFLEEEEEEAENDDLIVPEKVEGLVEFDNVVFGYQEGKDIIKHFNATIKPGQKVAIVGPTGAGKTTLVNLLMRFYEIRDGSIKIDGVDIRQMKRSTVRKLFGMVLQDTWLFHGTIRENIAYGNLKATEEEIVEAAKAAHVDHFVRSLPHGYNMYISEEADNISQGEKQLLTIARAMLANTPMLILDEATSSVDTRTEVLIQEAMVNLMKGRTCFVIAHRLSTIKDADLILVMNEGNIVELGSHHELLEKNGFYASLYNSQFADPALN